jgi:hypothetical protein
MAPKFRNGLPQSPAPQGPKIQRYAGIKKYRAMIRSENWPFDDSIVIRVVVGSSPIGHPKEFSSRKKPAFVAGFFASGHEERT